MSAKFNGKENDVGAGWLQKGAKTEQRRARKTEGEFAKISWRANLFPPVSKLAQEEEKRKGAKGESLDSADRIPASSFFRSARA